MSREHRSGGSQICLAGAWVLRKQGSDHVPGVEGMSAVPLTAKIRGVFKGERLLISQSATGHIEEVQLMLRGQKAYSCAYYQLGKLNYETRNICATIVGIDREFRQLSILRYGPARGQRSMETYTLDANQREVKVEINIDHPEAGGGSIRMVKYLVRSAESADVKVPTLIKFRTTQASNFWVHQETHSLHTLHEVSVQIKGTVVRYINTHSGNSGNVDNDPMTTVSTKAIETRRQNDGKFFADEKVTYYMLKVMMRGGFWEVVRRYKEFDAFRQLIESQGIGAGIEPFPRKTILRISGNAADKRRMGLETFMNSVISSPNIGVPNICDAICSFLEIPEHLSKSGADGRFSSQEVMGIGHHDSTSDSGSHHPQRLQSGSTSGNSVASALTASSMRQHTAANEGVYSFPQDALFSKLSQGVLVIKHGRHGRPHARMLRCNDAVTRIYWSDPKTTHQGTLPADEKSLHLREVMDVRRGTDPDPTNTGKTGTFILRKHCTKDTLGLCFSLIMPSRSFDVQCMNELEFNFLYGNFRAFCTRFTSRLNRDYDEASIITSQA